MSDDTTRDPLARRATRSTLAALRGELPEEVLARAYALWAAPAPAAAWRRALSLGLALLGAALVGAGVVYAVAFNWQAMDRTVRLSLPIVLTTGLALGGWRLGMARLGGVILLSLACLTAGTALLVHGQIYQTGAQAWTLFATWALLTVPWVFVARFAPLVLAWAVLFDTAFTTFWEVHEVFGPRTREVVGATVLTLGNGALLWLWERLGERHLRAGAGRWGPRALGTMTLAPITFAGWWTLLETERMATLLPLTASVLGGLLWFWHRSYRRLRPDLFMLTLGAFSVVSCLIVGGARVVFRADAGAEGGILLLAGWVVGCVAAAAAWLRSCHREMKA